MKAESDRDETCGMKATRLELFTVILYRVASRLEVGLPIERVPFQAYGNLIDETFRVGNVALEESFPTELRWTL